MVTKQIFLTTRKKMMVSLSHESGHVQAIVFYKYHFAIISLVHNLSVQQFFKSLVQIV